jgi:hypothetical protein
VLPQRVESATARQGLVRFTSPNCAVELLPVAADEEVERGTTKMGVIE